VLSLAKYCHECGTSLGSHGTTKGEERKTARKAYEPAKKKRAPSAYNKAYARNYAKLKKKHPRTSFAGLAKKAHRATKRSRK